MCRLLNWNKPKAGMLYSEEHPLLRKEPHCRHTTVTAVIFSLLESVYSHLVIPSHYQKDKTRQNGGHQNTEATNCRATID